MTDTEEPWSSYRKLNEGLQRLVNMLAEAQNASSPAAFIPGAQMLAQDLGQQAKTVETAAMVRALEFVRDGIVMPEVRDGQGPEVGRILRGLNETIRDCRGS